MFQLLKEKYGYTHQYILWGQPWILFLLELADQSQIVEVSDEEIENDNIPVAHSASEAMRMLGR